MGGPVLTHATALTETGVRFFVPESSNEGATLTAALQITYDLTYLETF
jgi:hypothetical protein